MVSAHTGAHPPSQAAVRLFGFPPDVRASIFTRPLQELLCARQQGPIAAAAGAAPPEAHAPAQSAPAATTPVQNGTAMVPLQNGGGFGSAAGATPGRSAVALQQAGGADSSNGDAPPAVHAASMTQPQAEVAAAEGGGLEAAEQPPDVASSSGAAGQKEVECQAGRAAAGHAAAGVSDVDPAVAGQGASGAPAHAADGAAPMEADMPTTSNGPACNGTAAAHPLANGGTQFTQQVGKDQRPAGTFSKTLPEALQQVCSSSSLQHSSDAHACEVELQWMGPLQTVLVSAA